MNASNTIRAPVTVAATMPPPVDGMTLATSIVVEALRAQSDLRLLDWSAGPGPTNTAWRFRKGIRSLYSALHTAIRPRRPGEILYTVANSRGGLYYNLLLVAVARLRRYRVILHHQVYSYLHRHDRRMRHIDGWLGTTGTHVVLSDGMEADFRRQYTSRCEFFVLPNTIVMLGIDPNGASPRQRDEPFRIGHCSNLSMEKGLEEVVRTARELIDQQQNVRLILAGPFVSNAEEQLVMRARRDLGDRLDYRGPVYAADKQQFYRDIDVLLFPTRYQNEAQPLVLAEAIAHGKPVIAYDRACIRSLVGQRGGQVVPEQDAFPQTAARTIRNWMDDRDAWSAACESVSLRAAELRKDAADALARFVDLATRAPRS